MDNNQKPQNEEQNSAECKCTYCSGKRMMCDSLCSHCHSWHGHWGWGRAFWIIIKIAIIFIVFWFGVKVGQLSGHLKTFRYNSPGGYYNMMQRGGYGSQMMNGYGGYAAPAPSGGQSTSTAK